jgi:hypothetical protein
MLTHVLYIWSGPVLVENGGTLGKIFLVFHISTPLAYCMPIACLAKKFSYRDVHYLRVRYIVSTVYKPSEKTRWIEELMLPPANAKL